MCPQCTHTHTHIVNDDYKGPSSKISSSLGAAEYAPLLTRSMDQEDIYTDPRREHSPEVLLPEYAVVNGNSINGEERTLGKCAITECKQLLSV